MSAVSWFEAAHCGRAVASLSAEVLCPPTLARFGAPRYREGESLLHCGVSDSRGRVWHFDEGGVHAADAGWRACLSVPLPRGVPDATWDDALAAHAEAWRAVRYHQQRSNCYDFVIAFMNCAGGICDACSTHTKVEVATDLVGPVVEKHEEFENVLRLLRESDPVVVRLDAEGHRPAGHRYYCDVCSAGIPQGSRHHCTVCDDYDLCELCHSTGRTSLSHKAGHSTVQL
eukprot:m51a1_g4125 hypothetical protein (229) ;mRNA; r:167303-168311